VSDPSVPLLRRGSRGRCRRCRPSDHSVEDHAVGDFACEFGHLGLVAASTTGAAVPFETRADVAVTAVVLASISVGSPRWLEQWMRCGCIRAFVGSPDRTCAVPLLDSGARQWANADDIRPLLSPEIVCAMCAVVVGVRVHPAIVEQSCTRVVNAAAAASSVKESAPYLESPTERSRRRCLRDLGDRDYGFEPWIRDRDTEFTSISRLVHTQQALATYNSNSDERDRRRHSRSGRHGAADERVRPTPPARRTSACSWWAANALGRRCGRR